MQKVGTHIQGKMIRFLVIFKLFDLRPQFAFFHHIHMTILPGTVSKYRTQKGFRRSYSKVMFCP